MILLALPFYIMRNTKEKTIGAGNNLQNPHAYFHKNLLHFASTPLFHPLSLKSSCPHLPLKSLLSAWQILVASLFTIPLAGLKKNPAVSGIFGRLRSRWLIPGPLPPLLEELEIALLLLRKVCGFGRALRDIG